MGPERGRWPASKKWSQAARSVGRVNARRQKATGTGRLGYDEPMAAPPATTLPVHRLDLQTYNRMVDTGSLREDERVELLEGLVVDMSPPSPEHSLPIELLTRHLAGASAWLRVQLPLEIPPDSAPQPDLALTERRQPAGRHPRSALLAVEVAVSSHAIDRGVKARLYARAGIPTYWLVDIPGRAVEVRSEPRSGDYTRCAVYREGSTVPSPAAGVEDLRVTALFAEPHS
jgi:Uma2 family endonuclease